MKKTPSPLRIVVPSTSVGSQLGERLGVPEQGEPAERDRRRRGAVAARNRQDHRREQLFVVDVVRGAVLGEQVVEHPLARVPLLLRDQLAHVGLELVEGRVGV
ncbi:hypothetical protein AB0M80_02730 [Amycolatopsis sp. NPDC051045]|uniref:hypothetical protein n=1 Tax=Amycolatopsis sp. NPDC051045 TaxID=3156922 RepID=UPI003441BA08